MASLTEKSVAAPAAAAPSMPRSHGRWHNTVRTRPSSMALPRTRRKLWRRRNEERRIAGEPVMSATWDSLAWIYDENRITTYLLSELRGQRNRRLPSDMRPKSSVIENERKLRRIGLQ